jgi:hypothetical protein
MIGEFTEMQPAYRYRPLIDGTADVFIYNFKEEKQIKIDTQESDQQSEQTMYVYDVSAFNVSQSEVTEERVKADPMSYFNYEPLDPYTEQLLTNLDHEYRLSRLELEL